MALNWRWEDKIGTWKENAGGSMISEYSIYKCNGLAVVLHEFTNENGTDCYQMHTFFLDEGHLKNMLGLSKGYTENCLDNLVGITLTDCKTSRTILKNLYKAKWTHPITTTLIPKQ